MQCLKTLKKKMCLRDHSVSKMFAVKYEDLNPIPGPHVKGWHGGTRM